MAYEVRTDVFEGPFDLLLRLITAQEVDVWEISLARLVDDYLDEVRRMESLDLDVATEFLLIAACLVELKCRRLLPGREEGTDEELALFEERDLLLARLVECRTFTGAAHALAALEAEASRAVPRRAGPDERFAGLRPDLLAGVAPAALQAAAAAALAERPRPRVDVDHVLVDEVTVAEVVDSLAVQLAEAGTVSFRAITAPLGQRMQVIVHFLAVLELYKQGLVEVDQPQTFGDIVVSWTAGAAAAPLALADVEYRG